MSDQPAPPRTRTFDWPDPATIGAQARGVSGLEFLRGLIGHTSAPLAACIDMHLVEVEEGRTVFELRPAEYHYNPMGTVHGGVSCTMCDSAMGAAVHSLLPVGASYTTLELKVNLLRTITASTSTLRCEGTVLSMGSRTALAQARLLDGDGKLCAHAVSTCMIFRPDAAK